MSKGQKIVMWVFGIIFMIFSFFGGMGMGQNGEGNIFVIIVLPIIILAVMCFLSVNRQKKN